MKIGLLLLMVLFLAVLAALLVMSYRMLNRVRKEERAANQGKVSTRQLHPKLVAELEQRKKAQQDHKAQK